MRQVLAVMAVLLSCQWAIAKPKILDVRSPPPSIMSKAWMMLAEKGPISNDFTEVSIAWSDGAFYMKVSSGRQGRWKLMLTPPLRDKGWKVSLLSSRVGTSQGGTKSASDHLQNVAWSRSFAMAYRQLPSAFVEAMAFQIRAISELKQIRYFMEIRTRPAWITFSVDSDKKLVILDYGF